MGKAISGLGQYQADVNKSLKDLAGKEVVGRIWRKDHTVWQPDPAEITNRLGWLTVSEVMARQVPALVSFADEVRQAGFENTVLLGMGGSSLGPEVLRQTFGPSQGYPALTVLDSTVPAWVQAVTSAINPANTLFLVSSKSGGTVETMSLYRYFHELAEETLGQKAGQNFAAITDAGSSLEGLAREKGFRRAFLNPADIGGRYSVLSYFGLVPAVLSGLDIKTLLERAESMRQSATTDIPLRDNPGAWLGAVMATLALKGRNKLTLVASPAIASFGLWAEQLIAESTGKDGKGIIPVAAEPLMPPQEYGDDRLFVYLRLKGDDNSEIDTAVAKIQTAGQPLVTLELEDRYDLGAESYRWEFAVAIAGAILGVHPFDQPDVQKAKDATACVLKEYQVRGHLPTVDGGQSLEKLLAQAAPGKYLAIMAYLNPTPEIDQALTALRRRVTARYHIATTLGYGPRFLHSTGQLHKGGPDSGLFLQITAKHRQSLPIPGAPYTFEALADAQALGDLQALVSLGRPVASVRLDEASGEALNVRLRINL
jgi:glucose-6-phosphate isomerase/transaldolase/glucose-6-phosphate isomerase